MKLNALIFSISCAAMALAGASTTASSPAESGDEAVVSIETGLASWYGGRWIGRATASGEIYRAEDMTAAHRTLPFGTRVRVIDETTGESTVVAINNRGPHVKGRVIDLSVAAAEDLGIKGRGVARVTLEVLAPAEDSPSAKQVEGVRRFFAFFQNLPGSREETEARD